MAGDWGGRCGKLMRLLSGWADSTFLLGGNMCKEERGLLVLSGCIVIETAFVFEIDYEGWWVFVLSGIWVTN